MAPRPTVRQILTPDRDPALASYLAGPRGVLANPDPILRDRGRTLALYEEVARDARVRAVFTKRVRGVVSREWRVDPGRDDNAQAEAAADLVRTVLTRIPFDPLCEILLEAVMTGIAGAELIWESVDGLWMPTGAERIAPERLTVAGDGRRITVITRDQPLSGVELPAGKLIVHRHGAGAYGQGVGQSLFWPTYFKRAGAAAWATGVDKHGLPTTIVQHPPGWTDAQIDDALAAARQVANETAIALPVGATVEFLQSLKAGEGGFEAFLRYWDQQIAEAVLGESLTTSVEGGGSRAAAEVHDDIRVELAKSDADLLAPTLARDLVAPIVRLNLGSGIPRPTLYRVFDQPEDLDVVASRMATLSALGWEPEEEWVQEVFGPQWRRRAPTSAPVEGEREDRGEEGDEADGGDEEEEEGESGGAFAAPEGTAPRAANLQAAMAPVMAGWLERIEAGLVGAASPTDAAAALLSSLADLDLTQAADAIRRGLVAAYLEGAADTIDEAAAIDAGADPDGLDAAFAADDVPGQLPFDEAIRFFRQKVSLPTERWTDLWEGQHARAFVVAGAMQEDLLSDLRGAVDAAIAEGRTLADFRRDFGAIVDRHGWNHVGGRAWRAAVIYDTNLRTAHAAGRWQQILRLSDRRPWLRYAAILDDRTRDQHRGWHGVIRRFDDAFWQTHYPPNGWRCRCTVISLSDANLAARGWTPTSDTDLAGLVGPTRSVPVGPRTVEVPEGIDPGFGHNVGIADTGYQLDQARVPGGTTPLDRGLRVPADPGDLPVQTAAVEPMERGPLPTMRDELERVIGGSSAVFATPLGRRVQVTLALADHLTDERRVAMLRHIPQALTAPSEIWAQFRRLASGKVVLRVAHLLRLPGMQAAIITEAGRGFITDVGSADVAVTAFPARGSGIRTGIRLYRAEGDGPSSAP